MGERVLQTWNSSLILFSSSKADTVPQTSSGWNVNLTQVILKDCRFRYIESDYEPIDYGINWTDVECRNLNVRIFGIDFRTSNTGPKLMDFVSGKSQVSR